MLKKLVAFGCSFTYGDELLDPTLPLNTHCCDSSNEDYRNSHCYAGIIAKHYNMEFINTAFPGASLEAMRYAAWWIKENIDLSECLFMVGYTNPSRYSFFVADRANPIDEYSNYYPERPDPPWNMFYHNTWLPFDDNQNTQWHEMHRLWVNNSSHEEYDRFNLDQTIGYFNSFNVPTVNMMTNMHGMLKNLGSNVKNNCGFNLHECLSADDFCPKRHPNENGHQKIAQRLIEYIDRVKLIE